MSLKRCENGHYFDPAKHTTCPSCGVQDVDFGQTKAKAEAAPRERAEPVKRRPAPADDAKTVSLAHKTVGADPVVGWLVCLQGADRGRDYRIRAERNFIGRGEHMDIAIRGDETISRENHAIVSFNPKNGQFKIHPGEGRGLVYLNGDEVDQPRPLAGGDKVELGQTTLLFVPFCGDDFSWES